MLLCAVGFTLGAAIKAYDEIVDLNITTEGMGMGMSRESILATLKVVMVVLYAVLATSSVHANAMFGVMALLHVVFDWALVKAGREPTTNLDEDFFRDFNVGVLSVFCISFLSSSSIRSVFTDVWFWAFNLAFVVMGLVDYVWFFEEISTEKVLMRGSVLYVLLVVMFSRSFDHIKPIICIFIGYLIAWLVSKSDFKDFDDSSTTLQRLQRLQRLFDDFNEEFPRMP